MNTVQGDHSEQIEILVRCTTGYLAQTLKNSPSTQTMRCILFTIKYSLVCSVYVNCVGVV